MDPKPSVIKGLPCSNYIFYKLHQDQVGDLKQGGTF